MLAHTHRSHWHLTLDHWMYRPLVKFSDDKMCVILKTPKSASLCDRGKIQVVCLVAPYIVLVTWCCEFLFGGGDSCVWRFTPTLHEARPRQLSSQPLHHILDFSRKSVEQRRGTGLPPASPRGWITISRVKLNPGKPPERSSISKGVCVLLNNVWPLGAKRVRRRVTSTSTHIHTYHKHTHTHKPAQCTTPSFCCLFYYFITKKCCFIQNVAA